MKKARSLSQGVSMTYQDAKLNIIKKRMKSLNQDIMSIKADTNDIQIQQIKTRMNAIKQTLLYKKQDELWMKILKVAATFVSILTAFQTSGMSLLVNMIFRAYVDRYLAGKFTSEIDKLRTPEEMANFKKLERLETEKWASQRIAYGLLKPELRKELDEAIEKEKKFFIRIQKDPDAKRILFRY